MQRRCLSSIFFALGLLTTLGYGHAYQFEPISILGDPVAPAILDQDGNGFCVVSEQANYGKFNFFGGGSVENFVFDAGAIFGNEQFITTPSRQMTFNFTPAYRYLTGTISKGTDFPTFVNAFFDRTFYPQQVFSPVGVGKMNVFFDLSAHLTGNNDENGDFKNVNPISAVCPDARGCLLPAVPVVPNFNPAMDGDLTKNQYADPLLKQAFPEVTINDKIRNTALRFRGFLNVKPDMIDRQICFGMYADDGAALIISDSNTEHIVLSATSNRCEACIPKSLCPPGVNCDCRSKRPPDPSGPGGDPLICSTDPITKKNWCGSCDPTKTGQRWRMSNCVRFHKPGLYPTEILYVAFGGNNALEVSVNMLPPDKQLPPGDVGPVVPLIYENWGFPTNDVPDPADTYRLSATRPLSTLGFTALDPKWIFQSTTGNDIGCNLGQCVRRLPSDPAFGTGCPFPGNFCNEAGNCEPCDEKSHCGLGCLVCAEVNLPNCDKVGTTYQCVQCRKTSDCFPGQTCGATDHMCHCDSDGDCPKGQNCQGTVCKTCDSQNACAGNSCSCCRAGLKCAVTDPSRPDAPSCVECTSIADPACSKDNNLTCDTVSHRCVSQKPACGSDDRCGPNCVACPKDRPLCLDGNVCVECRSDLDCSGAQYCLSGQCTPCNSERRCGSSCRACSADKPFCDARSGADNAVCVACFTDEQCGKNGRCQASLGQCENTCKVTCPPGLLCDDARCIQCRSGAQCGCGQFCDTQTGQCQGVPQGGDPNAGACESSGDCQGDECCNSAQQCGLGHCATNVTAHGGALCACNVVGLGVPPSPSKIGSVGISWMGLLLIVVSIILGSLAQMYRSASYRKKNITRATAIS